MPLATTARIAILGAGPVGLEAALYARCLGYRVQLIERSQPAAQVAAWGNVPLFTSAGHLCSSLGLSALIAQDRQWKPPAANESWSSDAWRERYLLPLSRSDLLVDALRLDETVTAVEPLSEEPVEPLSEEPVEDAPAEPVEGDGGGDDADDEDWIEVDEDDVDRFRIRTRTAAGKQEELLAAAVLDCTGRGAASGGDARVREVYSPDAPGRKLLIVGADYAAACSLALAFGVEPAGSLEIAWLADLPEPAWVPLCEADPFPRRRKAFEKTGADLETSGSAVRKLRGRLESLAMQPDGVEAQWSGPDAGREVFHVVCGHAAWHLAAAGAGSLDFAEVRRDSHSGGLASLSETLAAGPLESPLPPAAGNPDSATPNYFTLGSKSFGRDGRYVHEHGLRQIRDAFAVIFGRASLDLYARLG